MAKIGDLGIASSSNKPLGGSRKYMPPEFYTRKCTQKLDVFTFGLTFCFPIRESGTVNVTSKKSPNVYKSCPKGLH